jgi:hypothetical protein
MLYIRASCIDPGHPTLTPKNIFLESHTAWILTDVLDFGSVYAAKCLNGCLIDILVVSIIPVMSFEVK